MIHKMGLKMIPICEMTDVMKTCQTIKECPVEQHQWVRVNKGPFKGDLALVESVVNSKAAICRLIPRIPDAWLANRGQEQPQKDMFDHQNGQTKTLRVIPQTFKGLGMMVKTY